MAQLNSDELSGIVLVPQDERKLSGYPISRRFFEVLYTFNASEDNTRDSDYALPTMSLRLDPRHSAEGDQTPPMRVLVTPGRAPYVKGIQRSPRFRVPTEHDVDVPRYAFEDLCRVAKQSKVLGKIKDANFITDAITLSALYEALRDKEYDDHRFPDKKGIAITFQTVTEEGVTFMKLMSPIPHEREPNICLAAKNHMKSAGLKWQMQAGKTPTKLNVFKRVVAYSLGDFDLVVEVDNDITNAKHRPKTVEDMPILKKDDEPLPGSYDPKPKLDASSKTAGIYTVPQEDSGFADIAAHMWFSGTEMAVIADYRPPEEDSKAVCHQFSPRLVDYDLEQPGLRVEECHPELDPWSSRKSHTRNLKLLHRFLKCIKGTVETLVQKGVKKFALEHVRLADDEMVISLTIDGENPVDLVSPGMAEELAEDPYDHDPEKAFRKTLAECGVQDWRTTEA
ncbi:hypothetical protein GGS26DRAFT_598484 [Hypomontagnella submonticulosa]|nr:hypothetical protein GGS26DRAFT_598484 [Hypomontagnella submonticulosa]